MGETHEIQAVSATGQAMTGLTWASSDTNVVSLSTADPPVLTAVAADVTVVEGELPLGTVIWSNPGAGASVDRIVPAAPSPEGVADVFAFLSGGAFARA